MTDEQIRQSKIDWSRLKKEINNRIRMNTPAPCLLWYETAYPDLFQKVIVPRGG